MSEKSEKSDYWYATDTNIETLMETLNARGTSVKIHVINIFYDGTNYIAVYKRV